MGKVLSCVPACGPAGSVTVDLSESAADGDGSHYAKRPRMTVAEEPVARAASGEAKDFAGTVAHHATRALTDGDVWFLVCVDWWRSFFRWAGVDDPSGPPPDPSLPPNHPGPVDNSPILKRCGDAWELLPNLQDKMDYELLHEDGWHLLVKKFGCLPGHEIRRSVVESGMFQKSLKVEVELMRLRVARQAELAKEVTMLESRGASFSGLFTRVLAHFPDLDKDNYRAFIAHEKAKYEPLDLAKLTGSFTTLESSLYSGLLLVLDEKDAEGNWLVAEAITDTSASTATQPPARSPNSSPGGVEDVTKGTPIPLPPPKAVSLFGPSMPPSAGPSSAFALRSGNVYGGASGTKAAGLCGLQNLGNTCFMNSALQCLSNCVPLTEYFLRKEHLEDLNEDNPLGMGGRLASSYGNLIHQLWEGTFTSVIPRDFKQTVGQFAPSFSGYQQQDSQELMAFLMDGLHEDLNRIRKKPYVETKEAEGRPDALVAKEAWEDYLKRNDSIIVDLFHGQLKSTLVCPEKSCGKVSVKFDPFCYLSLPMPVKKEKQLLLTFVSALPDFKWTKYRISVPKNGATTDDVFAALAKVTGVAPGEMLMAEVTASRVHKLYEGELGYITDRDDIYVYQVAAVAKEKSPVLVFLYQRFVKAAVSTWSSGRSWQLTATPIALRLAAADLTPKRLYALARERAEIVFGKLPKDGDESWRRSASPKEQGKDGDDSGVDDAEASNHSTPMETGDAKAEAAQSSDALASEEESPKSDSGSSGDTQLFRLTQVNPFASQDVKTLEREGTEPVEVMTSGVGGKALYVSADWEEEAYEEFVKGTELAVAEDASVTAQTKRKPVALADCLRLFQEEEELGREDLWYCPACKDHRQASKQMEVWSAPQILIVHLKRFSYSRFSRDKIEARVDFPIKGLDMGPYVRSNVAGEALLYDLVAVSNHMGGLGGGHYTAYGLSGKTGRWQLFDDSHVAACASEDDVVSKAAYVLFYRRRPTLQDPNIEMEQED